MPLASAANAAHGPKIIAHQVNDSRQKETPSVTYSLQLSVSSVSQCSLRLFTNTTWCTGHVCKYLCPALFERELIHWNARLWMLLQAFEWNWRVHLQTIQVLPNFISHLRPSKLGEKKKKKLKEVKAKVSVIMIVSGCKLIECDLPLGFLNQYWQPCDLWHLLLCLLTFSDCVCVDWSYQMPYQ